MDATLLTILGLLVFATIIALVRVHRRDRCLKGFDDFHVTLAEQGGDLTWGRADIYSTGLEIQYRAPVTAREGHLERSFIFYKDQYGAMEALYRCPKGLPDEARTRREALIERTTNPGPIGRFGRLLRTWVSMIRDALVQAVGLFIGLAKTHAPGSAVLSSQEKSVTALSSEVIGHVGNAYDPLLEQHLFTQVVVEVTSNQMTRSYCGWLQNYTADFLLVLDAFANTSDTAPQPVRPYAPGTDALPQVTVTIDDGRLHVANESTRVYYVSRVTAAAAADDPAESAHPIDAVLPPGFKADMQLPPRLETEPVHVWLGTTDRVDMVVPRRHALVRHAAEGSSDAYATAAEAADAAARTSPDDSPDLHDGDRRADATAD